MGTSEFWRPASPDSRSLYHLNWNARIRIIRDTDLLWSRRLGVRPVRPEQLFHWSVISQAPEGVQPWKAFWFCELDLNAVIFASIFQIIGRVSQHVLIP